MNKSILIFTFLLVSICGAFAQTTTTFAGKSNASDPWTNFNNTTTTPPNAYFFEPEGISWDASGKMYITEKNKIRLYDGTSIYNRSGKLGDGQTSHGYANGTGVAGAMYHPISIVNDASKNSYIVDSENHAIRKLTPFVNPGDGQVLSVFAGANPNNSQGTAGTADGTGSGARFNTPKGITIDASGNLYVTDNLNFTIRKITPAGVVTTLSGKAGEDGKTDATGGVNSRFGGPYGIAILDANTAVVTDNWNLNIRKVNLTSGSTETICGTGSLGSKDGTLAEATFRSPKGIAVVDGLIFVADDSRIRVIDLVNKTVSTFAGSSAQGNDDGVGANAKFGRLGGLAYDGQSSLYVTDVYFNQIRKITIDALAPKASFTVTKQSLKVNEEATLTDNSTGKAATSRKWVVKEQTTGSTANVSIVSGDLNSSNAITVKFLATGFYTVSLKVTNEFGNDTKEDAPFFTVSTTGSGIEKLENLGALQIYPNPVSGEAINLSLDKGVFKDARIELFDTKGSLLAKQENIYGTDYKMDLPSLNSGTYFIVIHSASFNGAKMIMVK